MVQMERSASGVAASPLSVEDLSSLQARLLWCYEGKAALASGMKTAGERHLCAWWLLEGGVTLRRGTQVWRAGPGDWLFAGPLPHRQDFTPDAWIVSINFRLEWPNGDSLIEQPLAVHNRDFPALSRTAKPLLRFINRHYPGVRTHLWCSPAELVPFFELQRLFSAWMSAYLRCLEVSGIVPTRLAGLDARVLSALRILDRQPWTEPFREETLARQIGLSAGHLDRLFVAQLKLTPRAYLQKRRFVSALAQLSDPATPVKKIGYDLGFSSPGHFSFWFRKIHGQSPRQFRLAQPSATEAGKGFGPE